MRPVNATPGFVPHEVWDKFAWLQPHETAEEPWYYAAALHPEGQIRKVPTNPGFLKTVDPALRPLVLWLHERGIPTGPSCAGHDMTKRDFRGIYNQLEKDRDKVRTMGLILQDPENGVDYVMVDPNYELPWGTFEEFRRAASEHQPIGWLPFYTTDPRVQLAIGTGHGFEIKNTGPNTYGIRTTGENPQAWREATRLLKKALS